MPGYEVVERSKGDVGVFTQPRVDENRVDENSHSAEDAQARAAPDRLSRSLLLRTHELTATGNRFSPHLSEI